MNFNAICKNIFILKNHLKRKSMFSNSGNLILSENKYEPSGITSNPRIEINFSF